MRVLLATDGSQNASHAAEFLANLPSQEPIDLTVLTVSYLPDNLHSKTVSSWYPQWREMEDERIREHYEQLSSLLRKNTSGTVHMQQASGNPKQKILETAEEIDAELIVIGARGHGVLERLLIGSVSDAVATHARCSVLVVRPGSTQQDAEPEPVSRLVIAYDGSQSSRTSIADMSRFGWPEASTTVLSVLPTLDGFGQEYANLIDMSESQSRREALTTEAKQQIAGHCQKVEEVVVSGAHVGQTIVNEAIERDADVIFVGDSEAGSFEQFILGSTSKYVLRHAECSVWISRPRVQPAPAAEPASAQTQLQPT